MHPRELKIIVENAVEKALAAKIDFNKDFFQKGDSVGFKGTYAPDELALGIKEEMEHTDNPLIAEKIAKDHLAKLRHYYSSLIEWEKKLENK